MPSRRRLLAGIVAAGTVGSVRVLEDLPARVGVASASSTSGPDWPMARYDAAGTGHNPDASGPKDELQLAWKESFDDSGYFVPKTPILVDGTIYVTTDEFAAFDAVTGDRRFSSGNSYRLSSPAYAPSSIYRTDTLAVATPVGVTGLNAGGGVGLFGLQFGTNRWQTGAGTSGRDLFDSPAAPVVVEDTVYAVVHETGEIVALEADNGRERWRRSIVSRDGVFGRGGTPRRPAVRDGTVFVTTSAGYLRAFDAATGELEWRDEGDELVRAPTATGDAVVVPTRNGVATYEADAGDVRWERDLEGNTIFGTAAVADGAVFVADGEQSLHALDLETGDEEWSIPLTVPTTPVVADGVVYAGDGRELVALDSETGDELFTYESALGFSQPAVGNGVLYVVDDDRLLALEGAA